MTEGMVSQGGDKNRKEAELTEQGGLHEGEGRENGRSGEYMMLALVSYLINWGMRWYY